MRAQRLGQAGEIVLLARGAEHLVHGRDHHDVADAVGRQLEALAGLRRGRAPASMPSTARSLREQRVDVGARRQIDRREGAERAVMHDIGIGDRQDDARLALAQPVVEQRPADRSRPARRSRRCLSFMP